MTDPLHRLLDQAYTPDPPADFVDRIVTHATAQPQQASTPASRRRDRRGGWVRRPRMLVAFIGANLLVASAVAATIAGGGLPQLRHVPVIAPVFAALAPAPKPKPVHHARPHRPAPTEVAVAPQPIPTPQPVVHEPPPRMERMLARGDMLAARVAEREAAGLPVPPRARKRVELHNLQRQAVEQWQRGEPVSRELRAEITRQRFELAPPAVQQRIERRIQARREAGLPIPPVLDAAVPPPSLDGQIRAERRLERWRAMSPAERRAMKEQGFGPWRAFPSRRF